MLKFCVGNGPHGTIRRAPRTYQFLLSISAAGLLAYGQVPSHIVMSPVPIWSQSSALQAPPAGQTAAFFDTAANQLVLVSSDALGSARQVRWDIPNATKAAVSFSIQSGPGGVAYTYALTDDPQALQRSKQLSILTPASDTGLESGASGSWQYSAVDSGLPDRTSAVNMGTMRWVRWRDASSGKGKIAGARFTMQSPYLPGFADAFVEGQVDNPITADALANLPPQIGGQAKQFLQPGIGSAPYIILAPLFRPGTSKHVIAANYHYGISALMRSSALGSAPAYSQQLLQSLGAFLNAGATGAIALPSVAPNSPVEKAIQQSVALALQ